MKLIHIHPKFLDNKGLTSAWRLGVYLYISIHFPFSKKHKALRNSVGFKLIKQCDNPREAIDKYCYFLWLEAKNRDLNFNRKLICKVDDDIKKSKVTLAIAPSELRLEIQIILNALCARKTANKLAMKKYSKILATPHIDLHPLFVRGPDSLNHDINSYTSNTSNTYSTSITPSRTCISNVFSVSNASSASNASNASNPNHGNIKNRISRNMSLFAELARDKQFYIINNINI